MPDFENIAKGGPGLSVVIRQSDTAVLFTNNAFSNATGYEEGVLINKPFTQLLQGPQHVRFYAQIADTTGNPHSSANNFAIYPLLDKQGIPKPYYLYMAQLDVKPPSPEMIQMLLLPDNSANGLPFISLETKNSFLQQFDTNSFGTFEWMIDADKMFWSAGMYGIYELADINSAISYSFTLQFVHPQDVAFVQECIANTLRDRGDMAIEYRIVSANGKTKLVHCLASVVADSDSSLKLVGSLNDITRQRDIEDSLKNKVNELHLSNRELEEFAYAASHDMQEPLRKITTFSERLTEQYKGALTGDGTMYISRMAAAAENMRLLINGLLEFSKISKTSSPFERTDLDGIVRGVMTELELKIEETGTTIHHSGLPAIQAVTTQMHQLFLNLIGNSIKFHRQGVPPLIRIEGGVATRAETHAHSLPPGKTYYKIVVADNGIGFEGEYATRIFQVFQRLHGKSEYPGSGIGLAICKKILEYHHGTIYADSTEGAGARFVLLLPEAQ